MFQSMSSICVLVYQSGNEGLPHKHDGIKHLGNNSHTHTTYLFPLLLVLTSAGKRGKGKGHIDNSQGLINTSGHILYMHSAWLS